VLQLVRSCASAGSREGALRQLFRRVHRFPFPEQQLDEWRALRLLEDTHADELRFALRWRNESVFGRTLLHEAVCANQLELVRLLVQVGADLDMPNNELYNWRPLHEAVVHAGVQMTALVLSLGADTETTTASTQTPFDLLEVSRYAPQKQEKELLFRLWRTKFDIHSPSVYEWRKLPVAVKSTMRTFLLCWAQLRLRNRETDECETNLGHCDRLVTNTILHFLWTLERHERLRQLVDTGQ
jgi:hypothetical protein